MPQPLLAAHHIAEGQCIMRCKDQKTGNVEYVMWVVSSYNTMAMMLFCIITCSAILDSHIGLCVGSDVIIHAVRCCCFAFVLPPLQE